MLTHCLNSDVSDAGSVCLWGSVSTPLKMNGYLQADWLRAGGSVVKKSAWWVGKIPWRRKWQSTLAFLAGECRGQRRLAGYSPGGCKELDLTERLSMHFRGQSEAVQINGWPNPWKRDFSVLGRKHGRKEGLVPWILDSFFFFFSPLQQLRSLYFYLKCRVKLCMAL